MTPDIDTLWIGIWILIILAFVVGGLIVWWLK